MPSAKEPAVGEPLWKDVVHKTAQRLIARVPVVGDALSAAAEIRDERALERRIRFLEDLAGGQADTLERLIERLTEDEDLSDLFWRAWNAAGDARSREKVRVLAAAVAAVSSGERLSVSSGHVLLGVIETLEPIHLQTMLDIDQLAEQTPPISEGGADGVHGARRTELENLSTLEPEILGIVIADLQAKQLVDNAHAGTYAGMEGKEALVLTTLGDQVRQLLLSLADERGDDAAHGPPST